MTSWISDALTSHKVQLVATAVVSGAVVASAVIGLQTAKRVYRINDLKDSIPSLREERHVGKVRVLSLNLRQALIRLYRSTNSEVPLQSRQSKKKKTNEAKHSPLEHDSANSMKT